ncbi:MAG TPA: hypothetical protein VNQ56_10680 [Pseudolabrys sp.]|nr:hypothetical protein [Pseudolabrys sp.]
MPVQVAVTPLSALGSQAACAASPASSMLANAVEAMRLIRNTGDGLPVAPLAGSIPGAFQKLAGEKNRQLKTSHTLAGVWEIVESG